MSTYSKDGMVSRSFGSTEVGKGSAFLPQKAEEHNEEVLPLSQHLGSKPNPTSLFSTCYPPSLPSVLVLIRPQRAVEICIKMLFTWEVAGRMSQNCYFKKFMTISIHWLYSGSYIQGLL